MAVFYKGVPVGTFWHTHDPRSVGFTSRAPTAASTLDRIINHVGKAQTISSPYISLTLSYSVAWTYAAVGRTLGSPGPAGFIYEIELNSPLPTGIDILDPVKEVAASVVIPLSAGSNPYQHNGWPDLLLALVGPGRKRLIQRPIKLPPGNPVQPARISDHLLTLVRGLRDAEILVLGSIPANCVKYRYDTP